MTPADPLPLEIDPQHLAELRNSGQPLAILDVREPWELALSGFPEAIHVPLGELAGREAEVPRDRPVVVVCRSGRRSLHATRHLRQLGLDNVTNLEGGIEAWALTVDPEMPRY